MLVYVTVHEWRERGDTAASVPAFVATLWPFLSTAAAMLGLAGLLHAVLWFTVDVLVVPVWLLAVFVVVATGFTQTMPGETFEEKLEQADADLRAEREDRPDE